jgi:hypothetical protein
MRSPAASKGVGLRTGGAGFAATVADPLVTVAGGATGELTEARPLGTAGVTLAAAGSLRHPLANSTKPTIERTRLGDGI